MFDMPWNQTKPNQTKLNQTKLNLSILFMFISIYLSITFLFLSIYLSIMFLFIFIYLSIYLLKIQINVRCWVSINFLQFSYWGIYVNFFHQDTIPWFLLYETFTIRRHWPPVSPSLRMILIDLSFETELLHSNMI